MGMYAKLMARITESSLMEEGIDVRYCFMMLLAIADPKGYVVGTDVAIARRLNMPKPDFKRCLTELMKPDEDSNSKEHEGRRVILSDCERGYFVVNYVKYRDTRDEEQRREYMRNYMRKQRHTNDVAAVNNGKQRKPKLAKEEGEVEGEENNEAKAKPSRVASPEPSERGLKFADWFKTTLDADIRLGEGWREQWAVSFDEMLRLDNRTAEDVFAVCKWARADDSFWKAQILSPLKLRKRNDDKIQYFDVLAERMKKPAPNNGNSRPPVSPMPCAADHE